MQYIAVAPPSTFFVYAGKFFCRRAPLTRWNRDGIIVCDCRLPSGPKTEQMAA